MYVDAGESTERIKIKPTHMVAMLICVVFVIYLCVFPDALIDACAKAAEVLFTLKHLQYNSTVDSISPMRLYVNVR